MTKAFPALAYHFKVLPWELVGGDPWCTYDELDAFVGEAEAIADAAKKRAEEAKKSAARKPRRR